MARRLDTQLPLLQVTWHRLLELRSCFPHLDTIPTLPTWFLLLTQRHHQKLLNFTRRLEDFERRRGVAKRTFLFLAGYWKWRFIHQEHDQQDVRWLILDVRYQGLCIFYHWNFVFYANHNCLIYQTSQQYQWWLLWYLVFLLSNISLLPLEKLQNNENSIWKTEPVQIHFWSTIDWLSNFDKRETRHF